MNSDTAKLIFKRALAFAGTFILSMAIVNVLPSARRERQRSFARATMDGNLRRMRLLYSERSEALQQAAEIHWSDFLVMSRIESGLDTAVLLRPRIDDRAAAAAAARANIELRPLSGHSQRRPRLRGFVVGFAAVDSRSIFDGASRFAQILKEQVSISKAHRPVSRH